MNPHFDGPLEDKAIGPTAIRRSRMLNPIALTIPYMIGSSSTRIQRRDRENHSGFRPAEQLAKLGPWLRRPVSIELHNEAVTHGIVLGCFLADGSVIHLPRRGACPKRLLAVLTRKPASAHGASNRKPPDKPRRQ
jgi:hypothetical protein